MSEIPSVDCDVLILMASFNGSAYIKKQIQSIQGQTISNWRLIIRDDGSTDETISILESIIKQDKRIVLLKDKYANTGAAQANFCHLLNFAHKLETDYIFLSDQDDVWLPHKIEHFISAARKVSDDNKVPLLIHSDLQVVDKSLKLISTSFVNSMNLSPINKSGIKTLAFQNSVTGCACMINAALLDSVAPMPYKVLMHDWWLALSASSIGKIVYLPEAHVKYRQHGKNTIGAISYLSLCNPFSKQGRKMILESRNFIHDCYLQVDNLRERLIKGKYSTSEVDILLASAKLNRFYRIAFLVQNNYFPKDKVRRVGFIVRHCLTPRSDIKIYANKTK